MIGAPGAAAHGAPIGVDIPMWQPDLHVTAAPAARPAGGLPTWAVLAVAVALSVPLGLLALVADTVPGEFGTALSVTASTGVIWGVGAVAVGAAGRRPAAAAGAGLAVMAVAILVYYGGNAVWQVRPNGGGDYLAGKAELWLAVALLAGPAAGLLGWRATHGGRAGSAVAIGTAAGLVVAQGVYAQRPDQSYLYGSGATTLTWICVLLIAVPAAVALWAARRRMPLLALAVAAVVGFAGAAVWGAGHSMHLFSPW